MGFSFVHRGDFKKTEKFLKKSFGKDYMDVLEKYALQGVSQLSAFTPVDSGTTASSWSYTIEKTKNGISIYWNNSNIQKGINIAIILQYGHATRNGGYVSGVDYINPALKPIFEKMADAAWKEVTSL